MQIQIWIRIQIQGFDDQKIGKNLQLKKTSNFFDKTSSTSLLWVILALDQDPDSADQSECGSVTLVPVADFISIINRP